MRIAGAILAAGASRRLGRPKQLLRFRGEPLLRVLAREVLSSRCYVVGAVIPAGEPEIARSLAWLPIRVLENTGRDEGMASSIRLATAWANEVGCDGLVLTLCDQVYLTGTHVDALIGAMGRGISIAASRYAGTMGVPALFRQSTLPLLLALRGDAGARSVIRATASVATVEWPQGAIDIDTAGDAVVLTRNAPS
jgi:CTP:molybdopterin cytidylyltransferase MocA